MVCLSLSLSLDVEAGVFYITKYKLSSATNCDEHFHHGIGVSNTRVGSLCTVLDLVKTIMHGSGKRKNCMSGTRQAKIELQRSSILR